MKFFQCLLFAALVSAITNAQQITSSTIDEITVYLSGAKITRNAKVQVTKGFNEILLSKLSPDIDDSSIQVSGLDGLGLSGLSYQIVNADAKSKSNDYLNFETRIDSAVNAVSIIDAKISGLKEESLVLQSNRSLNNNDTGLTLSQLKSFGNYYNQRTEEIAIAETNLNLKRSNLSDKLQKLKLDQNKLDPESNNRQGSITLKLNSLTTKTVELTISYNVDNAGWIPIYDIRANGKSPSVALDFKGQIYQKTGADWNNVAIKLSTGDPNIDNTKPVLETKRLRFVNYGYSNRATGRSNRRFNPTVKTVSGKVTDPSGEPILGATVMVRGTSNATTTDFDGDYVLDVTNGKELIFKFSGYNQAITPIYSSIINEQLDTSLDAIVVTSYKTSTKERASVAASVETSEIEIVSDIEENIASRIFTLNQKYNIPSTGETIDINISSNNIASTYEYYTAPAINENVFLTAILNNYERLNLIPGDANVYFDDTYTGKIYFDTDTTDENLIISLGIDPQITVKREDIKDLASRSFLGSNRILEKQYEITLKNNRSKSVQVKLQDRIPISANSEIKIDDIEIGTASINKDTNILTWILDIPSGIQEKRDFSYQVKYPKNRRINEN
ncbi:conserved hypothetical protein [Nonlabens sp. Hel1_33_55]|uniref:DUF4139 domain-containing protein n=1 Tax=Nonlabens sp. Hel1_33_55 TaxID=1336802 RepID=UPI000875CB24|nr:DUF4139 domain-containing protein [Nonlabens sp. Hel1_33_55]SCY17809.1 conserved hypothetical protein [Nonlabens sp. Hel1_33_55]